MLKFIWGKGTQPVNPERAKLQKELFAFQKTVHHGFPHKPTSLAWDPDLKLLAIGTKKGALRIYGRPGVEFYGYHSTESSVIKLLFLPGQGRIVSLTEDNVLHLWEINGSTIQEKKSVGLDGRLKRISCLELDSKKRILVGTEGGNIYKINLRKFVFDEHIIYQDLVIANCNNEAFKLNPGAAESVLIDPTDHEKILIGYARGLIVLWDRSTATAIHSYVANQQLECLAWRNDGSEFVSAHNDGSYIIWSKNKNSEPPNMPYGPYPCKAITKFKWIHQSGTVWMIFSGGMPRASYGDKYTVTLMKGESDKHVVFDLTSKIIDFVVVSSEKDNTPKNLFILAEEELVTIDLQNSDFPVHRSPYLNSIHSSAVTCINQVSNVAEDVYTRLEACYESEKVSKNPWPVTGGVYESINEKGRDILITGHEDGSVKFWSAGGIALTLLAVLKTSKFFFVDDEEGGEEINSDKEDVEEDGEEWPPFRKVGTFDPYSDDPRMAVKKVSMCGITGRVFVGGTAGQVVVCDLLSEENEKTIIFLKADLVTEKEGFTWKGHSALSIKTNELKLSKGYQPACVLQINPPASINSLGFQCDWGIMAAGTAHGIVFMDCMANVVIASKCTLNAQDIANADDNPMSRRKSLKKSLRESFRRLRKGRSQRNVDKKKHGTSDTIKKELRSDSPDTRPVERQVEARSGSEDGLGSMVRCLHFANTFIANPSTMSPTLWAGTNGGQILIFILTLPKNRTEKEKATALLAKEIQLKHRAPVIDIQVLDSTGLPISSHSEEFIPHRVLIASEEQFKIFVLPTLKPCGKYKLTAHEGSRIRRVGFTSFTSKSNEAIRENCFVCLTNLGDIAVHSLPELRRQIQTSCIKKEDVIAISTLVFTPNGEAFYLSSSSEIQRVSVAAAKVMVPTGTLTLSSEARMEAPASPTMPTSSAFSANKPLENLAGDAHNETTISEISADITLDSVKDHTVISQTMETSINEANSHSRIERMEVVTKESVSLTKVTSLAPPSIHISSSASNKTEVNGDESQVNGALSENLDNSIVIEDHLNRTDLQENVESKISA